MKKNIRKRGFMMRSEDERKLSNNLGQNGPLALIFEIFGPETLFGKYIGVYHFLWYSSLVSSSTPFFCSTMAPGVGIWNLKNKLGTRAHEARVLLSHVSLLPTLKPYVTQSLNHLLPRAKHTHKPNLSISLLPLSISLSPSQSKAISTQILSFCLSISRSASFSVSISLSVSLSHCCSRSRSPSHKVCLAQLACSACGYFCL